MPLPAGANITQVHVLHRHGSRYPTTNNGVQKLGTVLTALVRRPPSSFPASPIAKEFLSPLLRFCLLLGHCCLRRDAKLDFLQAANKTANFTGQLSFLNNFVYGLGVEILVPIGQQELFDSGVLHYYDYGHLYNTSTKIIARTTTQDR